MQSFLTVAAVAVPSLSFFALWQFERAERQLANRDRQTLFDHTRLLARELAPLRDADEARRSRLSAAVAKGNRTRSWKLAAARFDATKYTPATVFNLHQGVRIIVDGGFPCVKPGSRHFVRSDESGFYIACANGNHYLAGQLDEGTRYIGVYVAPSLREVQPEAAAA